MLELIGFASLCLVITGYSFRRQFRRAYNDIRALYGLYQGLDLKSDCCRAQDLIIDGKKYDFVYYKTEKGYHLIPVNRDRELDELEYVPMLHFDHPVSIGDETPVNEVKLYLPPGCACGFAAASAGGSHISIMSRDYSHGTQWLNRVPGGSVGDVIERYGAASAPLE